jgi:hypothetical protein
MIQTAVSCVAFFAAHVTTGLGLPGPNILGTNQAGRLGRVGVVGGPFCFMQYKIGFGQTAVSCVAFFAAHVTTGLGLPGPNILGTNQAGGLFCFHVSLLLVCPS